MKIFLGIDPSRKGNQAWCCIDEDKNLIDEGKVRSDKELLTVISRLNRLKGPWFEMIIGVEKGITRLLDMFYIEGLRKIYELDASKTAAYRKVLDGTGCKSDQLDAKVCAYYVSEMFQQLRPYEPPSALERQAKRISRALNQIRETKTGYWQRFWEEIDYADPGLKDQKLCQETQWFLEMFQKVSNWKNLGIKGLEAFLTKRHVHIQGKKLEQLFKSLKKIITKGDLEMIQLIVRSLKSSLKEEALWLKRAGKVLKDWKYGTYIATIKGAGPKTLIRLLAYVGEDWSKMEASKIAAFAGLAPIGKSTGTPNKEKMKELREKGIPIRKPTRYHRLASNRHLKTALTLFALYSMSKNTWPKEAYKRFRERGQTHWEALRNLGIKWVRIMVHLAKNELVYDEQIHRENQRNKTPQYAS